MSERPGEGPGGRVKWGPNLYRLPTMGDGSCYFHSLLQCLSPEYREGSAADKRTACSTLRSEIAKSLTFTEFLAPGASGTPLHQDLPQDVQQYEQERYELLQEELDPLVEELNHLQLRHTDSEFTALLRRFLAFREYIKNPRQDVGDELHLLASRVLNLDIYVSTDEQSESPGYMLSDPRLCFQGRDSVILFHSGNHWEPIVQLTGGEVTSLFPPQSVIILQLRQYNEDCWRKLQR